VALLGDGREKPIVARGLDGVYMLGPPRT